MIEKKLITGDLATSWKERSKEAGCNLKDNGGFYKVMKDFLDREAREQIVVCPDYMLRQPDANERYRAILIDWLMLLNFKYRTPPGTLYATINLVDRYFERVIVNRKSLQLVGATCFLIVTKIMEPPGVTIEDIVYLCDNAYTHVQVRIFT